MADQKLDEETKVDDGAQLLDKTEAFEYHADGQEEMEEEDDESTW
jgi:hypothetical protein